MTPALIDKAAAELVEELLESTRKEGGEPWFLIIQRKLKRLVRPAMRGKQPNTK